MNKQASRQALRSQLKTSHIPTLGQCAALVVASSTLGCLPHLQAQAAEPSNLEDRLKKIEQQVQSLQKENADLKAQLGKKGSDKDKDKDKDAPAILKAAGKEQKISLGGMIQTQFEAGDVPDSRFPEKDRFLVRRARLNIKGSFAENFGFKIEGDFGNANLRENASYRVSATDVYVDWTRYDFANVRVGQMKTPFGIEQLLSDSGLLTAERSMTSDRFTLSRQVGAQLSGTYYNRRLEYAFGAFNGVSSNNGFNDNEKMAYIGRISGTPLKTTLRGWDTQLSLGVNGYTSDDQANSFAGFGIDSVAGGAVDDLLTGRRSAWGLDAQLKVGILDFAAEYFRTRITPVNDIPADHFEADGFYLQGSSYILKDKLQGVVRFESVDPNMHVAGNSSDEWVFGLNYYVKGNDLKLQLNYILGSSAGAEDNVGRFVARLQLLF